jgi:c(7)-type cytochrome triheme protein
MKTKIHIRYLALGCLLFAFMLPALAAAPGDLLFEREDQSESTAFPPSIFPHWKHRIHYRCDACHNDLFKMKLGETTITMDMMSKGESCAVCHDGELAFDISFSNCARCHRAPAD